MEQNKKGVIILDIDGVLLNYSRGFESYFDLVLADGNIRRTDFSSTFGISEDSILDMVDLFNQSKEFSCLSFQCDSAKEILLKLKEDYYIVMVSSCIPVSVDTNNFRPHFSRINNIEMLFGMDINDIFDDTWLLPVGTCKLEAYRKIQKEYDELLDKPCYYIVDDNISHIKVTKQLPRTCGILYLTEYTKNGMIGAIYDYSVNNWVSLYHKIQNHERNC